MNNKSGRDSRLNGLEIVLAGGSGGLGSEAAKLLARDGARLFVSYCHNKGRAVELEREISSTPNAEIKIIRADITKPADRTRLLDSAPNLYGLVVLTGIPARGAEDWEQSLSVNYSGPIRLAREAAERMRIKKTKGSIILMGTLQAVRGYPGIPNMAYAGAKAALIHAGRILAKEFRSPDEIRINTISPGAIRAGMAKSSINSGKYNFCLVENLIARFGEANDVAQAIRFFLEPENYITGQNILIDGGLGL